MEDMIIPDGFLRLSDSINQLGRGIWGGMRRPAPLRAMKPEDRRGVSVGFGLWKEEAGRQLRTAVIEGKIAVYVFASSQSAIDNLKPSPVVLPKTVLSRMIPRRGGLPDQPIRASLKIAGGDEKILELLRTRMGLLLVNANEFKYWYRSERAKGKWPSQRSKLKRREGRPSKQTDTLRKAVITAMQKKTSIAELRSGTSCGPWAKACAHRTNARSHNHPFGKGRQ